MGELRLSAGHPGARISCWTSRPTTCLARSSAARAGSLHGKTTAKGVAELNRAIELAPDSPDVRYIVADAYTYGLPDPVRAAAEANLALAGGLDTARVHAILAASHNAFGELLPAAEHIERHFDLVTTELISTAPLSAGNSATLDLVPGRSYAIPIAASAGQTISISTSSPDFWDSIAVLFAPDGAPVVGSDDDNVYFAAFDWEAVANGHVRPVRLVIRERLHGRARRRAILIAHRLIHEGPILESGSGPLVVGQAHSRALWRRCHKGTATATVEGFREALVSCRRPWGP